MKLIQSGIDGPNSVRLMAVEIILGRPEGMLGVTQLLGGFPNHGVVVSRPAVKIKMSLVVAPSNT